MTKLIFPIFLLLITLPAFAKTPVRTIEGTVTKVLDGDTIQVTDTRGTELKVRLYGIDAPEIEDINKKTGKITRQGQPFGNNAQQALEEMVANKYVRLDVMLIDQHKRTVAIVWTVDGIVNTEMIKHGRAWAYKKQLDSPYASEYIKLEEQAREERRGLWEQNNPQPPWELSTTENKTLTVPESDKNHGLINKDIEPLKKDGEALKQENKILKKKKKKAVKKKTTKA